MPGQIEVVVVKIVDKNRPLIMKGLIDQSSFLCGSSYLSPYCQRWHFFGNESQGVFFSAFFVLKNNLIKKIVFIVKMGRYCFVFCFF